MTAFQNEAVIRWLTHPPEGMPRMTVGSGAMTPALPVEFNPGAAHPLATSPGELLAGAIGTTFAWFAAHELLQAGHQAHELIAEVTVSAATDDGDIANLTLSAISCTLRGRVPAIDQGQLEAVSKAAIERCVECFRLRPDGLRVHADATLEGH